MSGSDSSSTRGKNSFDQMHNVEFPNSSEHIKEGGFGGLQDDIKVEAVKCEEKQRRKRKRTIMNDKQITLMEKALLEEPDMQRNAASIQSWAEKLSVHVCKEYIFQFLSHVKFYFTVILLTLRHIWFLRGSCFSFPGFRGYNFSAKKLVTMFLLSNYHIFCSTMYFHFLAIIDAISSAEKTWVTNHNLELINSFTCGSIIRFDFPLSSFELLSIQMEQTSACTGELFTLKFLYFLFD